MSNLPTAEDGTRYLFDTAKILGQAVLTKRTPQAARAYIGWIEELGPLIHKPGQGELETALDLAVADMERACLEKLVRRKNYEFFKDIAALYGLKEREKIYDAMIASLNGSPPKT